MNEHDDFPDGYFTVHPDYADEKPFNLRKQTTTVRDIIHGALRVHGVEPTPDDERAGLHWLREWFIW